MLFLSPLLGSLIATIILLLYSALKAAIGFSDLLSFLSVIPLIFFIVSIISYIFSIPMGYYLIKKQNEDYFTDGTFIFYSFIAASLIGLAFSFINLYIENSILKAIVILLCFSLGGTFNASFYVALKKQLQK